MRGETMEMMGSNWDAQVEVLVRGAKIRTKRTNTIVSTIKELLGARLRNLHRFNDKLDQAIQELNEAAPVNHDSLVEKVLKAQEPIHEEIGRLEQGMLELHRMKDD
ncbi:unnamed protein product [marine sediment metagenome]|uniref:Uncharacterized protein n=1 Tax=marine sediment metagenome TaxID=412755 RepID=X0WVB5_9ZZZZ